MVTLSLMDSQQKETNKEKYGDEKDMLECKIKIAVRLNGVGELRGTLGSLPALILALKPLRFTGGERRTKKYQILLSSDSRGAHLATNLYNDDKNK
jgi:hypothetical protein